MANTCVLDIKASGGNLSSKYSDESVTERFLVQLDVASRNLPAILNSARLANPSQFPLRGQSWPANPTYGLYAKQFQFEPLSDLQFTWVITVNYLPLQPGEQNTEGTNDNPLLWPATYSLEWIEREEAVTQAKNIEALGQGSTTRAALTLGPVVNSALQELEEGIYRAVRRPVLCKHSNVASLDNVLAVESFADTTNSDTVFGIGPRRYQYLSVDTPGQTAANGITYYPRTIRVAVEKTTEFFFNNVGWHNLDFDGKKVKYKVLDQDENGAAVDPPKYVDPDEPGFLTTGGARSVTATKLGYRWLTEQPYASLLI